MSNAIVKITNGIFAVKFVALVEAADVRSSRGTLPKAAVERRVATSGDQFFFAFISQLSGWALVPPSCYVLMYEDQCCKVAEESYCLLFIFCYALCHCTCHRPDP